MSEKQDSFTTHARRPARSLCCESGVEMGAAGYGWACSDLVWIWLSAVSSGPAPNANSSTNPFAAHPSPLTLLPLRCPSASRGTLRGQTGSICAAGWYGTCTCSPTVLLCCYAMLHPSSAASHSSSAPADRPAQPFGRLLQSQYRTCVAA